MDTSRERILARSGRRNLDLDINRVPEPFEVFVYNLSVPGHPVMELHMPIGWVGIGSEDEIVFSGEGERFIEESRELALRFGSK